MVFRRAYKGWEALKRVLEGLYKVLEGFLGLTRVQIGLNGFRRALGFQIKLGNPVQTKMLRKRVWKTNLFKTSRVWGLGARVQMGFKNPGSAGPGIQIGYRNSGFSFKQAVIKSSCKNKTCPGGPFWCPNIMCFFLKSPAGLLIFVFWFQDSCFLRARRVSWPLFLVPKTHAFLQPRRFPDICFWCPKLMFFWEPSGFPDICLVPKTHVFLLTAPTFAFGAQNSCTGCLRARRVSWHLFLAPKTHVFFEIPASFLTFVLGVQNSCFWRAQKVSWHLFWCPKFMYFLKEPGGFPDIIFWFQNSCFLRSAQNSCFC